MGPICQECNKEQLHVIALENTGGMVTYACEQCGAKNTLVELTGVKELDEVDELDEQASGAEHEVVSSDTASCAERWTTSIQEADSG